MEIVGKIIQVLPLQQGTSARTGNPWSLQAYVLETQEQYPRKVHFEVFGDDRIRQNSCQVDDIVTVSFDLESREFNGRWYTSVRAWKIQQGNQLAAAQPVAGAQPVAAQPAVQPAAQPAAAQPAANVQTFDQVANEDDGTDLPF